MREKSQIKEKDHSGILITLIWTSVEAHCHCFCTNDQVRLPEPHVTYVMHNAVKLQVKTVQLPLEQGKHDLNPK